jgi:hypothetical protein
MPRRWPTYCQLVAAAISNVLKGTRMLEVVVMLRSLQHVSTLDELVRQAMKVVVLPKLSSRTDGDPMGIDPYSIPSFERCDDGVVVVTCMGCCRCRQYCTVVAAQGWCCTDLHGAIFFIQQHVVLAWV